MSPTNDRLPAYGKVLVVDDDANVLNVIERFLTRKLPGARIYAAGDAEHALDVMESQSIDVVLSDYRLPRANGLELLGYMQRHYPHAHRLMLTGAPIEGLAFEASESAGTERFFMKPVDLGALARVIDSILRGMTVHGGHGPQV